MSTDKSENKQPPHQTALEFLELLYKEGEDKAISRSWFERKTGKGVRTIALAISILKEFNAIDEKGKETSKDVHPRISINAIGKAIITGNFKELPPVADIITVEEKPVGHGNGFPSNSPLC